MAFSIAGLTSSDPKIRLFIVEVYSDSGLTNLVDVQSSHGVSHPATGGSIQHGYMSFPSLSPSTTYYFKPRSTDTLSGNITDGTVFSATTDADPISGPVNNPMTTQGDIIVGGASGTPQVLHAGTAGYALLSNGAGALPSYQALFSSGNNANGYWVKDPTGHIRQWGRITSDINGTETSVTFPTPFTSVGSISVSVTTLSSADRITFVVNDGTLTAFGFDLDNNGSSGYAFWQADGY